MSDSEDYIPSFKPGKAILSDLLGQGGQDEELRKYKESLKSKNTAAPSDDSRKIVMKELRIMFEDRPGGDIIYPIDKPESITDLQNTPFTLKEGCNYKIRFSFKVQNDIASGVKYIGTIYKKGIQLSKDQIMLGSFSPQDNNEITVPRHGWEQAPSGMLSRGSYTVTSSLVDDDTVELATVKYAYDINSDWISRPTQ